MGDGFDGPVNREPFGDIGADKRETRLPQQVRHVAAVACRQVVDADDLVSAGEQGVA
jgi:hypothetical protein